MMLKVTPMLLTCAAALACTGSRGSPSRADDLAAITRLDSAGVRADRAGDVEAFLGVFADSAVVMPPNGSAVHGKAALRAWASDFFNAYTLDVTLTLQERQLAGDWAFDRFSYVATAHPRTGGAPVEDRGKQIVVYRREADGTWKMYLDIWNSDLPLVPARPGA